jgi:hypothetical protein
MGRAETHLGGVAEEEWMLGLVVAHREEKWSQTGRRFGGERDGHLQRERRSEVAARGADCARELARLGRAFCVEGAGIFLQAQPHKVSSQRRHHFCSRQANM